MSDTDTDTPRCPLCGSESSEVSWQTANYQEVCGNGECPINTWDPTVRWIEFDCNDCGKHVSRPEREIDVSGLTPQRCGSCTLGRMAEQ